MNTQAAPESSAESRATDAQAARVQAIVEDCLARGMRGEVVDEASILAAHADLLPELAAALRHLQLVHAACQVAAQADTVSAENGTPQETPAADEADGTSAVGEPPDSASREASADDSSLTVRCPHCHTPTPLVSDATLTSLTCPSCGNAFSLIDEADELPLAGPFGHFEILRHLGSGGFGAVYQAHDRQLDRQVALKVPRRGQLAAADVAKFLREARTAAQLRHPHIVSVHEVGRHAETFYIVSDLIDGESLAARLAREPLAAREAATLCQKIASALEHAHAAGIIHRDLKPANVLLDAAGEPHITDFGLARRELGEVTMTTEGVVVGTPAYMSPEQARGQSHTADRRSDVYSLGVILFELLTSELPFRGNIRMTTEQIISEEPPSPRKFNPTTPRDLETITLKCLEKDPARRYQTAGELAADLGRYLRGEPIVARPIGRTARTWRWYKRNPRVAGLTAAVAGLLLAIGISASGLAWRETIRRQTAVAQEKETYRSLYFSDMHRATEALADGNVGRVMDLLNGHRPQAGREDLRGFEWYYLWRQCQRAYSQRTLQYGAHLECAALSLDATRLAASGLAITEWPGTTDRFFDVKIWELPSGELLDQFLADTWACAIEFSPDGTRLAFRGGYAVTIWDLANSAQRLNLFNRNRFGDHAVALSPDGRILATATDNDQRIRLWDIETGRELRKINVETAPSDWLKFSADGELLASVDSTGDVTLFESSTGQPRGVLPTACGYATPVCFTVDGKSLISGGPGGTILVWELESRTQREVRAAHSGNLVSLGLSQNGELLASASTDGIIKLWDMHGFQLKDTLLGSSGMLRTLALSGDGRTLAACDTNGMIRLWDLSASPLPGTLRGHLSGVFCVAASPDGERAASGDEHGTVKIWDLTADGEPLTIAAHIGACWTVAFDPTGKLLASGGSDGVRLWNSATGDRVSAELEGEDAVGNLAFAPDGKRLLLRCGDSVRIWDLEPGERPRVPVPAASADQGFAVSPDGRLVATAGQERGAIEIRDLQTLDPIHTLTGEGINNFTTLAFSPDGRTLASASDQDNGVIKLWDWEAERELHTLVGHTDIVRTVAFSSDRKTLASTSLDGTIRLWDATTGIERAVLRGHSGPVRWLAFTPDGRTLLSGGDDKTVRVWRAASEDEVRAVESEANRPLGASPAVRQVPTPTTPPSIPTTQVDYGQRASEMRGLLERMPKMHRPIPVTEADWKLAFYPWKPLDGQRDGPPPAWEELVRSQPIHTQQVRAIDFFWGGESPGGGVLADYFALVATATIDLADGNYTFRTLSDDGVRVFLDGQVVLEDWTSHRPIRNVATAEVQAGKHDLRIEYYEAGGEATLQFGLFPTPNR